MAQDGLASFEPAFVDELAIILRWAFDYIQRDGTRRTRSRAGCATKRAARSICACRRVRSNSPTRKIDAPLAQQIIDGGYWLRPPGPNCEIVIAYQGVLAPEAVAAAGFLAEDRRDVAVLAVTSADRLNAGWQAATRARMRGERNTRSHVETLLSELPPSPRSSPRSTRIPRPCRGSAACSAIAPPRSASSISARAAASPISMRITDSTCLPSCMRRNRSCRGGRSAI
jgi:pyruvate dehydrogenase E1 component